MNGPETLGAAWPRRRVTETVDPAAVGTSTPRLMIVPGKIQDDEPKRVHDDFNENCPLNDPETHCNQVVSGLPCTCPIKEPT